MRHVFYPTLAVLLLAVCASPAIAAGHDTATSSSISDEAIDERFSFIEQRLEAGRRTASVWQYGWTGFYAISTVFSGVLLATADDEDDRVNYGVGTVKSLGALAGMVLNPLPARKGADPLQSMGADNGDQRLQRLHRGEELLENNAARAQTRTSWKRHLIGWATNLVGGGIIWAFGEERDAVVSAVGGIIVGELNIWTEPRRSIDDQGEYEKRFPSTRQSRKFDWQLAPFAGGIAILATF